MNHTIIIAEAGVNHNGDAATALQMVRVAAEAGADYIKFQTFNAEKLVARSAVKAEYQQRNCGDGDTSQLAMLKKLELTPESFRMIAEECERAGIGFLSTPFDLESIDTLAAMHMDYWKLPSGEITNLPYLRKVASKGGKIILSTGMSTLEEVSQAVEVLEKGGIARHDIILLHCTTQYPTPMADVNLRAMDALRTLGCGGVGYSDHTQGIEVPVAAVALGAAVIEKHFTLDKSMDGPDHRASLNPQELRAMVDSVRNIERALGDGNKRITPSEAPNIAVARKSIVAARPIHAGELLTEDNLTVKRPGNGLSPMMWDTVIGTRAKRDFDYDSLIEL